MTIPANIRINTNFPFPALVQGSGGITVAKKNGIWTIGLTAGTATGPPAYVLGTLPQARLTTIPAGTNLVLTTGYRVPGDGGGAQYVRVATQPLHNGWFQSTDGAFWAYIADSRGVNCQAFGAIGDCTDNNGTTGTDNFQFIQDAIDFGLYFADLAPGSPVQTLQFGGPVIYLPSGRYKISKTLQFGYGVNSISTIHFEGDGKMYGSNGLNTGSAIITSFSNAPGINVQGARSATLRDFSILGINWTWVLNQGYMGGAPLADDMVLANWLGPTLDPNANSQFTPYAGIAVDAYSGAQPATHYPAVNYPSWLPGSPIPQYSDKIHSSGIDIRGVDIWGFVVAVAVMPSNADGNGDFIRLTDCYMGYNVYLWSNGNSQAREFTMISCSGFIFHTGITTVTHGQQNGGLFGGTINTNLEWCCQLFQAGGNAAATAFKLVNFYSENIWRIGDWGGASSANSVLSFDGFSINFNHGLPPASRGLPPSIIGNTGNVFLSFKDGSFTAFGNVLPMGGQPRDFAIENVRMTPAFQPTQPYQMLAHNFLAGGLAFDPAGAVDAFPEPFTASYDRYDVTANATSGLEKTGSVCSTSRAFPLIAYSRRARPKDTAGISYESPALWTAQPKVTLTSCTLVGTVLTMVFAALPDSIAFRSGPLPGDVLIDDQTLSVFWVRSRVTTTVIAELQNNYYTTAGPTINYRVPISTTAGNFYMGNSRVFVPSTFLRGDTNSASNNITNVGNDQNTGITMTTEVMVGDWMYAQDQIDAYISPVSGNITAVTVANPGSFTLGGNLIRTQTIRPLKFFIRQPPANV